MRITESKLKKIISEEVERIISEESFPTQEEVLDALSLIADAPPEVLKENLEIIQELLNRAKKS